MNNSITEDYCSFEVSKLLNKKKFDIKTISAYHTLNKIEGTPCSVENRNSKDYKTYNLISRPTYALAIKWIRENFGIDIEITTYRFYGKYVGKKYKHLIYKTPDTEEGESEVLQEENDSDTHEQATEAALLFTLQNLIK